MHDRSLNAGSLHTKYLLQVQINVDGKTVEQKEYRLDLQPKESKLLSIDMPDTCKLGAFVVCRLLEEAGEDVAMTALTLPVPIKEKEKTTAWRLLWIMTGK